MDLDVVLFDVVDVHDFRQAFDALLLGADGEGFDIGRLDTDFGVRDRSAGGRVSATGNERTTATMSRLQMTVLATPGRLTGRTYC
jgi:hypothetical protein